jgi:hypothetical protein
MGLIIMITLILWSITLIGLIHEHQDRRDRIPVIGMVGRARATRRAA